MEQHCTHAAMREGYYAPPVHASIRTPRPDQTYSASQRAYGPREHVESGGLMSYGTDLHESYVRAAFYVDRILKGEKAGSLPIEFPTKLELVINLRTAKALGLDVPLFLRQRADDVIE